MASNRLVSTNFWKDSYIVDLDPTEKLLFLYLLTNPRTTIAGIYELSVREMAFDTGIDKDMILKILDRFQKDNKTFYADGWITLLNWLRHQAMNPKILEGAKRVISETPTNYLQQLVDFIKNNDSLSIAYDRTPFTLLNLTLLNLTKPNGTNLTLPNSTELNAIELEDIA